MAENPRRYWVYVNKNIKGPYYPVELAALPGFGKASLICPENALGQWREALNEPGVRSTTLPSDQPDRASNLEAKALQSLLEKSMNKNYELEDELREMQVKYKSGIKDLSDAVKEKNEALNVLRDKLKKAEQLHDLEHPSWETLYKTYKERMDGKLRHLAEQLGGKDAEMLSLRKQIIDIREKSSESETRLQQQQQNSLLGLTSLVDSLEAIKLEKEKENAALREKLRSVESKTVEMEKILICEKEASEMQLRDIAQEAGRLKSELAAKNEETASLRTELSRFSEKYREYGNEADTNESEASSAKTEIEKISVRLTGLQDELLRKDREASSLKNELNNMSAEIPELQRELGEKERENAAVRGQIITRVDLLRSRLYELETLRDNIGSAFKKMTDKITEQHEALLKMTDKKNNTPG